MKAPQPTESPDDELFDLGASRTLRALRDPETRQGLCNLLGVLAATQSSMDPALCQSVVDSCAALDTPAPDAGAATILISNDLSGLVQCSATATVVDNCVADLLNVAKLGFADASCSEPALGNLPLTALLGSAGCAQLLITCPDLFRPLLQALQNTAAPQ